jgi:hypothetical protein
MGSGSSAKKKKYQAENDAPTTGESEAAVTLLEKPEAQPGAAKDKGYDEEELTRAEKKGNDREKQKPHKSKLQRSIEKARQEKGNQVCSDNCSTGSSKCPEDDLLYTSFDNEDGSEAPFSRQLSLESQSSRRSHKSRKESKSSKLSSKKADPLDLQLAKLNARDELDDFDVGGSEAFSRQVTGDSVKSMKSRQSSKSSRPSTTGQMLQYGRPRRTNIEDPDNGRPKTGNGMHGIEHSHGFERQRTDSPRNHFDRRDFDDLNDDMPFTKQVSMPILGRTSPTSPGTPSQARRQTIHAHRLTVDTGLVDPGSPGGRSGRSHSRGHTPGHSDPTSPSSAKSRRSLSSGGGRQTIKLGAESLAIIHQMKEEEALANFHEDESMCGFKVGDKVTPRGGPDEHGPWEKLGDAIVVGPDRRKGYLRVRFDKTGDSFVIKGGNLFNLTDPDRSGVHVKSTDQDHTVKKRRELIDRRETSEVTGHTNDPMHGIKCGDHVSVGNGGAGIVVKEGATKGTVLVRFGDLGIRSVPANSLVKKKVSAEELAMEATKAAEIDDSSKKNFTLSLTEATGSFDDNLAGREDRAAKEEKIAKVKEQELQNQLRAPVKDDPDCGLKLGDYVAVDDGNPMWRDIGVGCIRSHGPKIGTFSIQFESGGDTWVIKAEQLKKKTAPDRKFRRLGQQAQPETEEGRHHSVEKSAIDRLREKKQHEKMEAHEAQLESRSLLPV